MAIKLLHASDLHLGAPFVFLGKKGQEQRQELLATLDKIVELAINESVDIVLFAGDLFDSNNPSYITIDKVVDSFGQLGHLNIPICLIPGSHDCYGPCSIYNLYNFREAIPNLTIFTDHINQKTFDHLDLTIYGRAVLERDRPKDYLKDFVSSTKTRFHVGLIHTLFADLEDQAKEEKVFPTNEIKNSKMNYIAIGHYHSLTNCSTDSVKAFYSGSPNMLELEQKNSGHVILVTIHPSGDVDIEPKRVGHSYFKKENIAVDDLTDIEQIRSIIKDRAHPQVFYEVHLTGLCSLGLPINTKILEALEQELSSHFLELRIIDNTQPNLEEKRIGQFPENTVLGQLISLAQDQISRGDAEEKELNEKALRLGFTLLQGKRMLNDY